MRWRNGLILVLVGLITSPARPADPEAVVRLLEIVIRADAKSAERCMNTLIEQIESGEFSSERLAAIKPRLARAVDALLADPENKLHFTASRLGAHWGEPRALATVLQTAKGENDAHRLQAVQVLLAIKHAQATTIITDLLQPGKSNSKAFRGALISETGKSEDPTVAAALLAAYAKSEPDLQPRIIESLLQRTAWSRSLLDAIAAKKIPREVLSARQVAQLQASPDKQLAILVRSVWGVVRSERDPKREQVIVQMRSLLLRTPGDAIKGQAAFQKLCGQCHAIYGEGPEVGPDITRNGRGSFEQLLSNVFDPNLVIGASYQARTVITDQGRILSGLVAEDNPMRVVLKMQGGKTEVIPRARIDQMTVSRLSLMPENLETQLSPQEIADLFAYLCLDRPPKDPRAKPIPGAPVFSDSP